MNYGIELIVVYENPADYPGKFVVRAQRPGPGQTIVTAPEPMAVVNTLEEARSVIRAQRPGLYRLDRNPNDDPVIVETWL